MLVGVDMLKIDVSDFIDDMVVVYEWVDFVVCRVGVFMVSEVVVVGCVVIFVLLFFVVDDY